MSPQYHPYYCEENIWHLNREPALADVPRVVLVMTNAQRAMAIWNQRIATVPGGVVLWDYHVVLAGELGGHWLIFDLDSQLPCPCAVGTYLRGSFSLLPRIPPEFHPLVRLVDAERYDQEFASDRSHMQGPRGFRKPVPPWPTIGEGHCLPQLLDLDDPSFGPFLELEQLEAALAQR